jgi:hypothetical protein
VALSKFDEQKKAEEEAKARLAIASPAPTPGATTALTRDGTPAQPSAAAAPSSATAYDGTYSATLTNTAPPFRAELTLRVANGRGSLTLTSAGCSPSHFSLTVSPTGSVAGDGDLNCVLVQNGTVSPGAFKLDGEFRGRELPLRFGSSRNGFLAWFRPGAASPQAAVASAPQPVNTAYDGTYRGEVRTGGTLNNLHSVFASLQVTNAQGLGSLTTRGCSPSQFSVTVSSTGKVTGEGNLNCIVGAGLTGAFTIDGKFEGKSLSLTLRTERTNFYISLAP